MSAKIDKDYISAEVQLEEFISKQPISIPNSPILDGEIHRFGDGEKGREPHWYIGSKCGNQIRFTIGSHKNPDLKLTFMSKSSRSSNPLWRRGSNIHEKWQSCQQAEYHAYLDSKKIVGLFGAKINFFGDLVIPMFSSLSEELIGLQTINADGKKLFVSGSKKKGAYFQIGSSISDDASVFVTEGFATAVTVHMATGSSVICTFDCGNLPIVVQNLVIKYPKVKFIVAGDDDKFSSINSGRNAGKAVSNVATAIYPKFLSDIDQPTDWNDLYVREGIEEVKKQLSISESKEYCQLLDHKIVSDSTKSDIPEVIEMVSGKYLEESLEKEKDEVLPALIRGHVGILCSPGGYGKSGVALLMANQIASGGAKDFLGFGPVVGGSAVILTLEDPIEIYSARHKVILKDYSDQEKILVRENLHLIKALCAQNAVNSVEIINLINENFHDHKRDISTLRLLVIDHLSYWSSLDLNESQSAAKLMREFRELASKLNCAVLLLHHSNRTAMIKGKDKQTGSAAMGGSYKFHSLSRWVAIIEESEKHCNGKSLILDKANYGKKLKLDLKHSEERVGLLYKDSFEIAKTDAPKLDRPIDPEVATSEIETFSMIEASPKLKYLDEDCVHIMNWLARNPAFMTVDNKRRNQLTKIIDGDVHDLNRENPSIHSDVWVNGDRMIVDGPICDMDDMLLYSNLIKKLNSYHRNDGYGLTIKTNYTELLSFLGKTDSGENCRKINRQLKRLVSMTIFYSERKSSLKWSGPLLSEVISVGEGAHMVLKIKFSEFMISFYRASEYVLFDSAKALLLKSDAILLYPFFKSHLGKNIPAPLEKIKKLLSIPEDLAPKRANLRIKKAIENLNAVVSREIGTLRVDKAAIVRT